MTTAKNTEATPEPTGAWTQAQVDHFAKEWINAWNAHDLERILSHYADDAQMSSPFIRPFAGTDTLNGKNALRSYWGAALKKMPNLRFELFASYGGIGSVCIHYQSVMGLQAVEYLRFNPSGHVIEASAHYRKA
jgi:hypothetical protein